MIRPRERSRALTTFLGFLIPCGAMLLVMAALRVCPFGNERAFLYSDSYHQYYPFFVQFRRILRSGGSLLYNWDIGMGVDYLGLVAYYVGSPLNLISVLLPDGLVLYYFCALMPIRLGLAGMFFTIFLKRLYGRQDLAPALFGAMYALCAWVLGYQWNVMWLDTFALLPLVMLGMVRLLEERRFLLYTLSLGIAVAANYYIGLFVCYFVFLTFFCYEICRPKGWKGFFKDLTAIAVFSVLALCLSAVVTVSAVGALQATQSSVNQFPTGFRLNIASSFDFPGLLDGMRRVAGNLGGGLEPSFKEGLPNIYCGVGTLLLGVLFLLSGEIRLREKLCALFLQVFFILSFLIRQLDYIWHGFHFPNMIPYRFSFLFSFVLLYMAYRAWLVRRSFGRPRVAAAVILTGALLACSKDLLTTQPLTVFGSTWQIPVFLVYNGAFLAIFGLILFVYSARPRPRRTEGEDMAPLRRRILKRRKVCSTIFCAIVLCEIAAMVINFGCWFPPTTLRGYPKGGEDTASMIRVIRERESDREFSRAEMTHAQTLNDDALNGYSGISAFTSSANVHITEFLKALGFGAKNTYNRYCYEESSPVADLFLNIKYMLDRDNHPKDSFCYTRLLGYGTAVLYENNYHLPLGFMTEPELADLPFIGSGDSFDFQNRLFGAATGIGSDVWHQVPMSQCEVLGAGVDVFDVRNDGFCGYSAPESSANVIYSFRADRTGFACIRIDFPKRNDLYISVNGVELYHETTSLPQMMAVTDVTEGDSVDIRIYCKAGEGGTLNVSLAILDPDVFAEGYARLSSTPMTVTSFSDTRVTGEVNCARDGLLYTSIPQNGNWLVYVDGELTEPVLVGDCMISLPLCAGYHRLEFVYSNRYFTIGSRLTLGSIFVLAILYYLDTKRRSAPASEPEVESAPAEDAPSPREPLQFTIEQGDAANDT